MSWRPRFALRFSRFAPSVILNYPKQIGLARHRFLMARHDEFELATQSARRRRDRIPSAINAYYDRKSGRVVIGLSTQMDVAFPPNVVQGLENASASQLEPIEITPSGFGIHFPKLNADLYLQALLEGVLGSKRRMAARLGALGGRSKSMAKPSGSRKNGPWEAGPRRAPQRTSS